MREHLVTTGRRLAICVEPGEELIEAIATACRRNDISQAVIISLLGAFREAEIIAASAPPADPEPPLPDVAVLRYVEGTGTGSVTSEDGEYTVHVHVSLGAKDDGGAAYAGHLLRAETHYVAEVVLDEILAPRIRRRPVEGSHGIPIMEFTTS